MSYIIDSKIYNRSTKLWLEKHIIELYSAHNEGNVIIAESSLEPLKFINTWPQYQKCVYW